MSKRRRRILISSAAIVGFLVLVIGVMVFLRRDDVLRASLDPNQPFQTWTPPPAPNYASRDAWALMPADPNRWGGGDPPADVFFIHPTTYDGGKDWNAAIGQKAAARQLARTMLPNWAGPYQRVGRVFAPRYRQASLFASLTNRDDARDARRFAYGDVREAFQQFLTYNRGRPIILAGVEQGGALAGRLLDEVIAPNPQLVSRLAAVYALETVLPARRYGPTAPTPICTRRAQAHCLVGWISVKAGDEETAKRIVDRAFVWDFVGRPVPLGDREPVCVNPILGAATEEMAPAKLNLGAANASGLEWGAHPAFLPRQVSARCEKGILRVSGPTSPSLVLAGSWADHLKVPGYNLFYADIEADAKTRVATLMGRSDFPVSAPSIDSAVEVREIPTNRIR